MKIEKTFSINAPIVDVWTIITDPERVAHCIPGCESVTKIDDDNYKAVVEVAIGPIRTSFNVDIACTEQRPPEFASYVTKGEEGGKSSRVKATSTLALASLSESETSISYSSDINIVGRLGKFGSGMVLKVADSMGDDFVAGLKGIIEGKEVSAVEQKTLRGLNRTVWIGSGILGVAVVTVLMLLLR